MLKYLTNNIYDLQFIFFSRDPIADQRNPEKVQPSDTVMASDLPLSKCQLPPQSIEELLNKLYLNSDINTTYSLATITSNINSILIDFVFIKTLILAHFWAKPRPSILMGPLYNILPAL